MIIRKISLVVYCLFAGMLFSQELTGEELLNRAIQYHDPNGNWTTFNGTLKVIMTIPKKPNRNSEIKIDLPNEYFYVKATRGENTTQYTINKGNCKIAFNGIENPSEVILKEHNLSCDRANLYKNYYTYLYGLPMKLKDSGTHIHKKVEKKKFKGKDYLMLKVTYDESIGKDTWYFYFNPTTYAMEIYQFFKETKNSGEYILLSGEETINGIKMPKVRAWYYNKNDGYLGTDTLIKS
jgi:hypothetical protein